MPTYWVTYEGTRFPVRRGETMIGRSAYCTIVVSDVSVSREHASLRLVDGVLLLTDLGSRNGTQVNGVTMTGTRQIQAGDGVTLGTAVIRIEATRDDEGSRRQTSTILEVGDDPTTQTTTSTVELMNQLVDQAIAAGTGRRYIDMIKAVVDGLVAAKANGLELKEGDAPKISRAAAFVVATMADGSLDEWRVTALRRLGVEV
jgi:hypothetical protein